MNTPLHFRSFLAGEIERFLSHHRALGKRFDSEEHALRLLDRFLLEQDVKGLDEITPALLEVFLTSRPRTRARSYNHLLNVLQRLFRWLVSQDVLPRSPVLARARRSTEHRAPFLFEPGQVERLLACAAKLPDGPHACQRGITYRMIFALMYGLGLRVSEAARFCRKDLDLERRCLHIHQTKFAKSRLVPFGPRTAKALQRYLQQHERDRCLSPHDPLFSLAEEGRRRLDSKSISRTFHQLLPELNLTVPPGVTPPRLHCLRHSFAVSTLLRWYRAGVDPGARLMHLSVFLGHVNPASTAVYLTVTADLLEEANRRFERFAAPQLREVDR
jgi:site-specific recombinase XerD